jgi:hypothetical protein
MTPVRRIAAAALVGALGLGFVGIGAGPASALDTTWGTKTKAHHSLGDTTWGTKSKAPKAPRPIDTTWGTKSAAQPTLDTTWGTRAHYFR